MTLTMAIAFLSLHPRLFNTYIIQITLAKHSYTITVTQQHPDRLYASNNNV